MKVLASAILFSAALFAADTHRIAGVVLNGASGRPAVRVRVGLILSGQGARESHVFTGPDGRFEFDRLAPGKYSLTADHPSGVRQAFGQPEGGPGFSTAVVAGPDLKTEGLVFRLFPPASIHGRVVDQAGDPTEGVLVQLFRSAVMYGRRVTFYAGSYRTNDIGEFWFGPIQSGTYYVAATGRPWFTGRLSRSEPDDPLSRITYVPTFYPGATDARDAAPIRLHPGEDFSADLTLASLPAGRLSIELAMPEEGGSRPNARNGRLEILLPGPGGASAWERTEWISGMAEYSGVPPGRYTIRAGTPDDAKPVYGQQTVVVSGMMPVTVEIPMARPHPVSGILTMQNGARVPRGAIVEMENEADNRHIRRAIDENGQFRFDDLPPGQYMPILMSPDQRLRLAGVVVDGRPATEGTIDVSRPLRLDLTGIAEGAEVAGFVSRNGEPQAGVLVVLVPKRNVLTHHDYQAYLTDSDGSFSFPALAAGAYRLVPIENWVDVEYTIPEVMRRYDTGARDVDVREIGKQDVRIELK